MASPLSIQQFTPEVAVPEAVGLALASHLAFKTWEPSAIGFIAWLGLLSSGVFVWSNRDLSQVDLNTIRLKAGAEFLATYVVTLGLSIGIYRLFFNPLRHFPGDLLPSLTKWQSFWVAKDGQTHHFLWAQHKKHGDFVRVGPNELSVADINQMPFIHGAKSKFSKGPWYWKNLNEPSPGLFSLQDYNEHKLRRKVWDTAFNPKALKAYEPRINAAIDRFCKRLDDAAKSTKAIDFSAWSEYMAFDIMGDLGFGASFHMVDDGKSHEYVEFVHTALKFMCTLAPVSWALPIIFLIPLDKKTKETTARFFDLGNRQFKSRMAEGPIEKDVFGHLMIGREKDTGYKLTDQELESDARNVILGGGDTTAVLLTAMWYFLTQNPGAYAKLKKEVNGLFQDEEYEAAKLGDKDRAPYINACINESLRLFPPGPNGMQRVVNTPGGIQMDGKYIPEGTKISVHGWTVHHDPRYFERPMEFIPERWLEDSEFKGVHNSSAFIPFTQGVYQCVGRRLALQEARMFIYRITKDYNLKLEPGYDPSTFFNNSESYLTITKPAVPMLVSRT
ncbi:MAG: hypothetical protein M1818_006239 [Claussenomyces sp. TS43310]|nr:MAG: hypothetical protein M1818_006239 [Claussenomyces sp. TS43310]